MSNEFLPSFPCLLEVSVVGLVGYRSGQSVLYAYTSILFIEMQQKKNLLYQNLTGLVVIVQIVQKYVDDELREPFYPSGANQLHVSKAVLDLLERIVTRVQQSSCWLSNLRIHISHLFHLFVIIFLLFSVFFFFQIFFSFFLYFCSRYDKPNFHPLPLCKCVCFPVF